MSPMSPGSQPVGGGATPAAVKTWGSPRIVEVFKQEGKGLGISIVGKLNLRFI